MNRMKVFMTLACKDLAITPRELWFSFSQENIEQILNRELGLDDIKAYARHWQFKEKQVRHDVPFPE